MCMTRKLSLGFYCFGDFFIRVGGFLAHFEALQVISEWEIPAMKYFLKKVKVFMSDIFGFCKYSSSSSANTFCS